MPADYTSWPKFANYYSAMDVALGHKGALEFSDLGGSFGSFFAARRVFLGVRF